MTMPSAATAPSPEKASSSPVRSVSPMWISYPCTVPIAERIGPAGDAVLVTCAAPRLPPALFQQLKEGGRLVLPLEKAGSVQILTLVEKREGKPRVTPICEVRFVPMTGRIDGAKEP